MSQLLHFRSTSLPTYLGKQRPSAWPVAVVWETRQKLLSHLPALASGHCSRLGNEAADGRTLSVWLMFSLCNSDVQINLRKESRSPENILPLAVHHSREVEMT